MNNVLLSRLCPHRGVGKENTLAAIIEGLKLKPFLLEFDVQPYHNDLHLGHPPVINQYETLQQALRLFTKHTIPKVDLKLNYRDTTTSIDKLFTITKFFTGTLLVNLSGSLTPDKYLDIEKYFVKMAPRNMLLNIDLGRYGGYSPEEITVHLNLLSNKVFSISPNLEVNLSPVILCAKNHHIKHIHFWAYQDRQYTQQLLVTHLQSLTSQGFEVYFDISAHNIV